MLPGLRAVIAATIATVGLMMIAFGAVAAFRVAQGSHGSLQAELAARTRMAELPPSERRPIRVIDTPGPHIAPLRPLPVIDVRVAPIALEFRDVPAPAVEVAKIAAPEAAPEPPAPAPPPAPEVVAVLPPAEPPMGGPLAEPKIISDAERAAAKAERARKLAAAKRARAARLARQRKAAARRAAQARAKQLQQQQQQQTLPHAPATTSFNMTFGNPNFSWGSGNQ